MSELLEPGAVYRALQEVAEGKDSADAYAELMEDAIEPEDALLERYADEISEDEHDDAECLEKFKSMSFCHGSKCIPFYGGNLMVDCPCKCHEWEELT